MHTNLWKINPIQLALIAASILAPATASAVVVTYTLSGVTFGDGGTASGSFTYDSDTNTYSNVSISTTIGGVRSGAAYNTISAGFGPTNSQFLAVTSSAANQTGLPGFALFFAQALPLFTSTGLGGQEATCGDATCSFPAAPNRFVVTGSIVAVVDFSVRYASNLTSGDSVINITNTGANGAALNGPGFGGAAGNICVNVYAFSPDEQLVSCCSCLITPNGLVSLSVNSDLISNTLTGVRPNSVVVKLVNTGADAGFTGTSCTNSAALAGSAAFPIAGGSLAFGTTIHGAPVAGTFAVTETAFSRGTLSRAELASITNRCTNTIGNGSTFGICRSCRVGGLGADRL